MTRNFRSKGFEEKRRDDKWERGRDRRGRGGRKIKKEKRKKRKEEGIGSRCEKERE